MKVSKEDYFLAGNKSLLNKLSVAVYCSQELPLSIYHTANETFSELLKLPITVAEGDATMIMPLIITNKKYLSPLVSSIISKQKSDPRYDYMTNEQVEIDRLVYQMYNLNDDDIKEVENWFFRRYPKLAKVIEEKMKGKNDIMNQQKQTKGGD